MSENLEKKEFRPYIPADKIMPELSVFAIILGCLLAVIFGGANAYLGLRIGMTVTASIPAAVVSMGIMRGILKRDSILENNMVQTIGSAGEALAAGAVFTIPAIFLWYEEWNYDMPNYFVITFVATVGSILGTLFMVPLRKALIEKEHETLPFPEGTACAKVLLAGEEGGTKAKVTFVGLGVGALYKLLTEGFKLFPSTVNFTATKIKGAAFGADILPALLGIGYIVGIKVSSYLFTGALIGWFAIMPLIYYFGQGNTGIIYPSTIPIAEMTPHDLWSNYLRYVGAGAVAFGGIYSLIGSIPTICSTFRDSMSDLKDLGKDKGEKLRTSQDISLKLIVIVSLVIILIIGMTPIIPVGILGAFLIAVFGFFFATVAARIVGIIGSANNPISGMTIATLLVTAFLFKATGNDGKEGMIATMLVGCVICIICSISGDTAQDLKTGYIVGATPVKQQIGQIFGVVTASLAIGGILILLHKAWGFGSSEISAPQATLMKLVVEGVFGGDLPWVLVFTGVAIGIAIATLELPVLPITIGLYLPIHLSTPMIIGGLLRWHLDQKRKKPNTDIKEIDRKVESGILFSSGLIAGEGLIGIILAIFTVKGYNIAISNKGIISDNISGCIAFAILCLILLYYSTWSKDKKKIL